MESMANYVQRSWIEFLKNDYYSKMYFACLSVLLPIHYASFVLVDQPCKACENDLFCKIQYV